MPIVNIMVLSAHYVLIHWLEVTFCHCMNILELIWDYKSSHTLVKSYPAEVVPWSSRNCA